MNSSDHERSDAASNTNQAINQNGASDIKHEIDPDREFQQSKISRDSVMIQSMQYLQNIAAATTTYPLSLAMQHRQESDRPGHSVPTAAAAASHQNQSISSTNNVYR